MRRLANEVAAEIDSVDHLTAAAFVGAGDMEAGGSLTTAQARTVLKELLESGGDPAAVAARLGFEAMAADDLAAVVDQVIADHPGGVGPLRGGRGQADRVLHRPHQGGHRTARPTSRRSPVSCATGAAGAVHAARPSGAAISSGHDSFLACHLRAALWCGPWPAT